MAPVAVMEHVGMIDIKFAGYAHMKELANVNCFISLNCFYYCRIGEDEFVVNKWM